MIADVATSVENLVTLRGRFYSKKGDNRNGSDGDFAAHKEVMLSFWSTSFEKFTCVEDTKVVFILDSGTTDHMVCEEEFITEKDPIFLKTLLLGMRNVYLQPTCVL